MSQPPPYGQSTITISTSGYPQQNYGPPPGSYQPPYGAPQPPYVTPQPPYVTPKPPNESWFERNQRNKPQSNSVGSVMFLFMTGGIFLHMMGEQELGYALPVAAIIGALLGASLLYKVSFKTLYTISSVGVVLSGIPLLTYQSYSGFIGSIINGLSLGLIFVTCLSLIGEESVNEQRGMLAVSLQTLPTAIGYNIHCFLVYEDDLWTGVCVICCGLTALAIMLCLFVESPVYHLIQHDEIKALESLRNLQEPKELNSDKFIWLNQLKQYLSESKKHSYSHGFYDTLHSLIKLIIYRGMVGLTYAWPVYVETAHPIDIWRIFVTSYLRWVAICVGIFIIDSKGRKPLLIYPGLVLGTASICFSLLYHQMEAFYALIPFHLMAGLFEAPSAAYLTEAFPLAQKSICIALAYATEMIVYIVARNVGADVETYFFVIGVMFLIFVGLSGAYPETKQTSLLAASDKFKELRRSI